MPLTAKEREILVNVIVYHYKEDIKGCRCGWSELGKSHARHVVQVFEEITELENRAD